VIDQGFMFLLSLFQEYLIPILNSCLMQMQKHIFKAICNYIIFNTHYLKLILFQIVSIKFYKKI